MSRLKLDKSFRRVHARTFPAAALTACLCFATAASGYDYYLTGSAADTSGNGMLGGLLLAGGSTDVDSAMSWFKSQVNGGDIVILRASGSDGYNDYLYSQLSGTAVNSVATFVMDSRAESWDPFVLDKINHAEGIFLAGGNQANYYNYWEGTPIEDAVNARAQAGAVIGGTSAGLAVMGSSAHVSLNGSLTSSEALNNPYPLGPDRSP